MRPALTATLGLGLVLASPGDAVASGNADCHVEDRAIDFAFEAIFSHGLGEPFSNIRSELVLRPRSGSAGLPALDLSDAVVHHWLHGDRLDLRFFKEGKEGDLLAEAELVVTSMRKRASDTAYAGRYALTISYRRKAGDTEPVTRTLRGRVACSVG